jgi:drug/metabolite transporter (DMT)-like permease
MHLFVLYSLIAAVVWGVAGIIDSVAGQYSMRPALLLKCVVLGACAVIILPAIAGARELGTSLAEFYTQRPNLFALQCFAGVLYFVGVYWAYCAFQVCGQHKALVIVISYCAPVLVAILLSYAVLGERYNRYAILGSALVLSGVAVINRWGIEQKAL